MLSGTIKNRSTTTLYIHQYKFVYSTMLYEYKSSTIFNSLIYVCISVTGSGSEIRAEVGLSVSLPCRVDTAQCGELHSVKWYRDNQRIYVFSHVAGIARPEGDGSDRSVNILYVNPGVIYRLLEG